jgi:hypothetical protein
VYQIVDTIDDQSGHAIVGIMFTNRLHPKVIASQKLDYPVRLLLTKKQPIKLNYTIHEYSNRALCFLIEPQYG